MVVKEIDTVEAPSTVAHLIRKLEAPAGRIDRQQIAGVTADRNPIPALLYLCDTVLEQRT